MKVNSSSYQHFTNAEHFQFMTDLNGLIIAKTPEAIDIAAEYPEFKAALADEDRSFKIVPKSALTKSIEAADEERDRFYSGFAAHVRGLQKHFDPETAMAAYRVGVQLESYGNLNEASYDQQTAGIYNLVQDLSSEKFSADVETLELERWLNALNVTNKAFESVMSQRYEEQSEKDSLTRLRTARLRTDKAYMALRNRINAGITFNGEAKYRDFVLNLNAHIDRYNSALARRRSSGTKEETEEMAEE